MAGSSYEYSPDTVGEIPYYCVVHPWMNGFIIVQEADAEEPVLSVNVSDGTGRDKIFNISGAVGTTTISIYTPVGSDAIPIELSLDQNGNTTYNWDVTLHYPEGQYTVTVRDANGYVNTTVQVDPRERELSIWEDGTFGSNFEFNTE